jgi:hypothetical protein
VLHKNKYTNKDFSKKRRYVIEFMIVDEITTALVLGSFACCDSVLFNFIEPISSGLIQ